MRVVIFLIHLGAKGGVGGGEGGGTTDVVTS